MIFVNSLALLFLPWKNSCSLVNFVSVGVFERLIGNDRYLRLLTWMYKPVDSASMVVFRIGYGAIMFWEVTRYFDHNWIRNYYTGKEFYFTYPGFSWVSPWPSLELMEAHFILIAVLAVFIGIGLFYRLAAAGMFVAFSYVYLLEQARYLNHFYFVALVALTMIFVPAHRTFSVDALLKSKLKSWPFLQDGAKKFMDNWAVWAVKIQFGITYFYGGLAKLNEDWLQGYPLSDWIADESHVPIIGPYVHERWMGLFLSYSGLILDLLFVPLLLWKRTRWIGLFFAFAFNLMNHFMFNIGIFPWFMIVGTLLFLEPDWPKRFWDFCTLDAKLRAESLRLRMSALQKKSRRSLGAGRFKFTTGQKWLAGFMITFFAYQFLFPFRHFLYPGVVHWTEEGHKYAWHMKLRSKRGRVEFRIKDPDSGRDFIIDPDDYLNRRQESKMSSRPDMILQFAHWLRDNYQAQGMTNVEVYAESFAALNGRAEQRLVDNTVDLAKVKFSLLPADWIVPLYAER